MNYIISKIGFISQQKTHITQHYSSPDRWMEYFSLGFITAQILSFSYSYKGKGYADIA